MLLTTETPRTSAAAVAGYCKEFRSYEDDAWYSVKLVIIGEKLTVKFEHFSEEHDAVFEAENFRTEEELEKFKARFRKVSKQVQDHECFKIVKDVLVCASLSLDPSDVRFYDAIIDDVKHEKHFFEKGEEECKCTFMLSWLHGPATGQVALMSIENICIVQSDEHRDPELASFIEIAKQKIKIASSEYISCFNTTVSPCDHGAQNHGNGSLIVKQKSYSVQKKCTELHYMREQTPDGTWMSGSLFDTEGDVGGEKFQDAILIQYLEKELSPLTVHNFIQKQTSIIALVYIVPSLPWVSYTWGAIVVDCKKDFDKLYDFLQNPSHIIISSTGRPWLVGPKMSRNDIVGYLMLKSFNKLPQSCGAVDDELKVVSSGTEEYNRAMERRGLFMQFDHHVQGLHKTLCIEECKLSQSSKAV